MATDGELMYTNERANKLIKAIDHSIINFCNAYNISGYFKFFFMARRLELKGKCILLILKDRKGK